MRHLMSTLLGLLLLVAGCATAPPRQTVSPEPNGALNNSAECGALWTNGVEHPKNKVGPRPYGWAIVRYDVERGTVVRVEVIDASPRAVVEAPTVAYFLGTRFLSQGSAQGCVMKHHWG